MNTIKDLSPEVINSFKNKLKGGIVLPSNKAYKDTRKVYNAMIDKHPGLFAMCENTDDVIASVNFGRGNAC